MAFSLTRRETVDDVVIERTATSDAYDQRDVSLTANEASREVDIDFTYASLKGLAIECTGALTIKTNASDATGGQTINVPAGGMTWLYGDVYTNPISANVTRMFLTDASGAVNAVKIRVLRDSTP